MGSESISERRVYWHLVCVLFGVAKEFTMPLERYRSRVILLPPTSTVYEAARAMEEQHAGAVLVGYDRRVRGVLTDRDIALEVVAAGLDPRTTELADAMAAPVATIPISASVGEAVQTMRIRGCRRVPLVEKGQVVGVVTLDGLLADGAIDAEATREIVQSQLELEEPEVREAVSAAQAIVREARARARHHARAERAYGRLVRAVERRTGLSSRQDAQLAMLIVLRSLCQRVTQEEGAHLIAQLPSKLHAELRPYLTGPDRAVTMDSITTELAEALSLSEDLAADILELMCDVFVDNVSLGQIESLRDQLPRPMKELFPPPYRRAF
jgi:CBS domain-containing protein/uncharacterized protein (DUF2267 family)